MLRRVALVRTYVSEERSACFIRVTRIGELGSPPPQQQHHQVVFLRSVRRLPVTASVVPSSPILVTLMKMMLSSPETLVLTWATRRNIPEDAILPSHRSESRKSYISLKYLFLCNSYDPSFQLFWIIQSRLRGVSRSMFFTTRLPSISDHSPYS
jgi:hypothetical protein